MASVFFGWEFGGGLGHLTRFLPIARRLYDKGHIVTLAVRDLEKARPVLAKTFPDDTSGAAAKHQLRIVESAKWLSAGEPGQRKMPVHSLADAMCVFDYQRLPLLTKMVQTWSDLLDQSQPDLIVGDFAPTLRLAHLGSAPFLMVGNGYTIPPPARLLPPIRPWQEKLQPFSRANEAGILQSLNIVRRRAKGQRVDFVADVLNGDHKWIFTIPEFDP
jgi:UDP:flavonoid glycosyltransferase YjiC (YdhE family)